jgi:hypothetical protein
MASELVVGNSSDMSEYVDVDNDLSSCCSVVGGVESSSLSLSSSSNFGLGAAEDAIQFCQCIDNDDKALLEFPECGSFYELGTYCPQLLE